MVNSCEKGKRVERKVANWLTAQGLASRRTKQYCGGAGDSDVLTKGMPIHWESKGRAQIAALNFLDQAIEDSEKTGHLPVVFLVEDGGRQGILLRPEDFIALLRACPAYSLFFSSTSA
jgi:hypothetical protein